MSLRFIVGRAGTGKTKYIIDRIYTAVTEEPSGPPVILLVPEQATFQQEYALTLALGGSIRAQVLSFRRLAYRVLLETGGASRVPIGELGKRMVLRELLERHQTSLRVFGSCCRRPGFTDCLARTIGEMKTYLVSPDHLDKACRMLDNSVLLRDKLADTALIYRELEAYLANRYTDPDDYLNLLAEKITAAGSLRGAEIWVDGFKGFTPQENAVIEKLAQTAGSVNIALCLDSSLLTEELSEDHPFHPTWKTYQTISHSAQINKIGLSQPVILDPVPPFRFSRSPDLAHLEKNFYCYPAPVFDNPADNVLLVHGANRRAEVEACAREIIRLARDCNYRWRDMAVMLRDLETYHGVISMVFQDYDIPFFIDRKHTVIHHPLAELIRSALEVVIKDWTYEPVFRCLKTDLVLPDREAVFILENYVLAHGIRGGRWTDGREWTYRRQYTLGEDRDISDCESAELAAVNKARKLAVPALANFAGKVSRGRTVRDYTTALFELLEELAVTDKLDTWRTEAEDDGRLTEAREHAQIWGKIISLLDELVEALGDEEISLEAYSEILSAGLETLTLGLIPPGLDQVVVGSLDRSRNPDIRAAFILGAAEGIFPARPQDDGIFNDTERDRLEQSGVNLAPGSRRRVFEEQFLIYSALTRASDRLWISYPAADEDGRSISPSPVIERIRELLPQAVEKSRQVEPVTGIPTDPLEFIVRPGRALSYLSGKLREARTGIMIDPVWWELYNLFVSGPWREQAGRVIPAIFHQNTEKRIPRETTRVLFGSPVKASVSRLEKFRACPFAHFSMYGLRLKERDIYRLEAPDMGELFHAALKTFGEELQRRSLDWGRLSDEQCLQLSSDIVSDLAPRLQSEILLSTARYRYFTGKLGKIVDRAVLTLAEHSRRSRFRPAAFEISFGPGETLPPLEIGLPDGERMVLSGRIDRLDVALTDQAAYLRVIDYKSSDYSVSVDEIFHGLKLQLLAYLHVALSHFSALAGPENHRDIVKPAGILYFTVKNPIVQGSGPMTGDEAAKFILARLKMKGLLLADPQVLQMMDNLARPDNCELFNVRLKTDGTFYSNAPVVDEHNFTALRSYLNRLLTELGTEIMAGKVSIEPHRRGPVTACRFCSFKPVCKFDLLVEGNRFRNITALSNDQVWQAIAGKEGDDEHQLLDR